MILLNMIENNPEFKYVNQKYLSTMFSDNTKVVNV